MKYFSYDPEGDGFTLHNTAEEAKKHAEDDLSCHRDNASEGWSDSVEHVCWGEVKQTTFKVREMTKEDAEHSGIYVSNDFDYICDYELKDLSVAINHVDALADALEALVSDYNQYRVVNGIELTDDHSAKLDVKMATAEKALKAYRGEK